MLYIYNLQLVEGCQYLEEVQDVRFKTMKHHDVDHLF